MILPDMKFRVFDSNYARALQECLFKLGYKWRGDPKERLTDFYFNYLFAYSENKLITKHADLDDHYFNEHKGTETTLRELDLMVKLLDKQSTKAHKHAELIKQWADGAEIQYYCTVKKVWCDPRDNQPSWGVDTQYRIKPEPFDIETYDIEVGDIWLVGGYYLFVLSITQCNSMSDGWAVQFCNQKGKHLKSTKCHLVDVKAELMFRRNGTVNRLNEI